MKFLMTYRERHADLDPAAAHRRVARLLAEAVLPAGAKVQAVLSRIGGGGGCAVFEAPDAEGLRQVAALFSAFDCTLEPVLDLLDGAVPHAGVSPPAPAARTALPEMPASEPHEGAFSDDDVYDWED